MGRLRKTSDFLGFTRPAGAARPRWWEVLIVGVFCSVCGLVALRIFGG